MPAGSVTDSVVVPEAGTRMMRVAPLPVRQTTSPGEAVTGTPLDAAGGDVGAVGGHLGGDAVGAIASAGQGLGAAATELVALGVSVTARPSSAASS